MSRYHESSDFLIAVALAAATSLTAIASWTPAIAAAHGLPSAGATFTTIASAIGAYMTPPMIVTWLGLGVVVPGVIYAGYMAIRSFFA